MAAESGGMRALMLVVLMIAGTAMAQQTGAGGAPGATQGGGGGAPTGSAAGVLSGTYPDPGLATAIKVINGISYSTAYAGSTVDVRVNACLADAMNKANGNTSGVCDASGEGGMQSIAAQITVGVSAGNVAAALFLPCSAIWYDNIADGVSSGILQYGGTTIMSKCPSSGPDGLMVFNTSSTSNPGYLFQIQPNAGYIYDQGFEIKNISGSGEGHATTGGIGFFINGQSSDATSLDSVNVFDSLDTYAVEVNGPCCQTTWSHSSINANFGGIPLYVLTNSTNFTRGFTYTDGTVVHPGTGLPAILCQDTRNSTVSAASFNNIYTETGNTPTTNALYQVNGCQKTSFSHVLVANYGSSAPGFSVTNAYSSFLTVDDVQFGFGTIAYNYPVVAVTNSYTGETLNTDSNYGNFGHYASPSAPSSFGPSTFSAISDQTLTTFGDIPYGGSSGLLSRLPANPSATDEVLVSHGTGAPSATTKTCTSQHSGVGTTVTCTWSTSPAAGEYAVVGVFSLGSPTAFAVTDSAGNTYVAATGLHASSTLSNGHLQLFVYGPLTSSITSLTVTGAGSPSYLTVTADSTTNLLASAAVDGTCFADTSSSTTSSCSSAITTTVANDFIFCDAANGTSGDTFTPGSGFTTGAGNLAQYQVQASIGATTPSITSSSAHPMSMACAAFLPSAPTNAPLLTNSPNLSLANGSTAVTQTTGDNSTRVATDAFVLANTSASAPSAPPTISSTVSAATYYVDNVNGSDSNNGISPSTPWKTIAHVNAATIASGSQVLFLSTDVWHEQITVQSAGITYGAYGVQRVCSISSSLVAACKNMPIIDGADAITGWTLVTGTTYSSPYTATASKGFVDSLYSQTTPLVLQTSLANLESTPGSIYSNGTVVYVNLADGSNPANHTIEVSGSRAYGILNNGGYANITVNGLEIIRTAKSGFLNYNSTASGINNVVQYSVFFNNGDTLSDSLLSAQTEAAILSVVGYTQSTTAATGFRAIGNWVGEMDFAPSFLNYTAAGIYAAGMASPQLAGNKIATVNGQGMRVGDYYEATSAPCPTPNIENNEFTNSQGNLVVAGCSGASVENNYAHDSYGNFLQVGVGISSGSPSIYIAGNRFIHLRSAYANELYNGIDVNYAINGVATGNLCADVSNDCMTLEADSAPSSGWAIYGNTFDASNNVYTDNSTPTSTNRVYPFYIRNTSLSGGLTMNANTLVFNAVGAYIKFGATSAGDQTHDLTQAQFDAGYSYYETPGTNPISLTNGTAATTQTTGDNSTKVATDAFAQSAAGQTYCVSNSGSDSNSGTATGPNCTGTVSAWQTLAHVSTQTLNPGDKVLLATGSTFREQFNLQGTWIGAPSKPITFSNYGTGALPIISGGGLVTSWTTESMTERAPNVICTTYSNTSGCAGFISTTGSLLVIEAWSSGTGTVTLKDTKGNTWTADPVIKQQSGFGWISTFHVLNNGNGFDTFYATGGTTYRMVGMEWTGNASSSVLDGTAQANSQSAATSLSAGPSSGSSGNTNDLVLGIFNGGGTSMAVGSGFTQLDSFAPGGTQLLTEYEFGPGNATVTATQGSSSAWGGGVLTYKAATVSGNLYYASAATNPEAVFYNGTWLKPAASKAQMTTGTWWYDSVNLRIYVFDNPFGNTVEAATRTYGIFGACGNQTNLVFSGIQVQEAQSFGIYNCGSSALTFTNGVSTLNYGSGLRLDGSAGSTVSYWTSDFNGGSGIEFYEPTNLLVTNDVTHDNVEVVGNLYQAGIKADPGNVSGMTIQNSQSFNNGLGQYTFATGSGIWVDTDGATPNVVIKDNQSYNNGNKGIDIDADNNTIAYGNTVYGNAGAGIAAYADGNTSMTGNQIYSNLVYGNGDNIDVQGPTSGSAAGGCENNTVNGNTVYGATGQGSGTVQAELSANNGCENPGTDGAGNTYLYNNLGPAGTNFIQWATGTFYSTYPSWELASGNCGTVGCSNSVGSSLAATNAANSFTAAQTAPGFFPQAKSAGPYSVLFDDYYSGANTSSNIIGSSTTASCAVNTTYTDVNHPGNLLLTAGTSGTGTGITCGYQSENPSVLSPNSGSLGWTWETAVYVPVLPGTTAGSFQGGLTNGPNVNPWTTGIQFYLSSANPVANDWYCRYSSTSTDSTIAAVAATWTRLTMVNDGTYVHWYINGTEATACKTPVGSMPSGPQYPASWSATALSASSVTMAVDYVDFQRATAR
jgi:hypothetical protein